MKILITSKPNIFALLSCYHCHLVTSLWSVTRGAKGIVGARFKQKGLAFVWEVRMEIGILEGFKDWRFSVLVFGVLIHGFNDLWFCIFMLILLTVGCWFSVLNHCRLLIFCFRPRLKGLLICVLRFINFAYYLLYFSFNFQTSS